MRLHRRSAVAVAAQDRHPAPDVMRGTLDMDEPENRAAARPAERGRSRRRLEDERFLTGRGRYIDDMDLPGQLFGAVVRSPVAHGAILSIDTTAALALPGVLAVFTAEDLATEGVGDLPCAAAAGFEPPLRVPPRPALARGRVRHVGDPVAFAVATSPERAQDAAEAVAVDYGHLRAVVGPEAALAPGAPAVWDAAPGNLAFTYDRGDPDAVASAMARASLVVEVALDNNRVVAAPLEPRAAIGRFDPETGGFDLVLSGQGVHEMRRQLAEDLFGLPEAAVHVSAPDVGGGFGPKNVLHPEAVLVLVAARRLGRPVRWSSSRGEDFLSTAQGRGNRTRARLALDAGGRFLALAVETAADMGAYLSNLGPLVPTAAAGSAMGGVYAIPAVSLSVRGAYTNSVPVDAYRGAGKPEANYLVERLVDLAARRLGLAPLELRRRNIVSAFPHRSALGSVIERGAFAATLDAAAARADAAGFPERRAEAARRGRLRGLGFACYLETARGRPGECAGVRFERDGRVSLVVGTQSNGQGHETSFAQVAADLLGLPVDRFRLVQADTRAVPRGKGHGGARSLHQGGAALVAAIAAVLDEARAVAARLLQCDAGALVFAEGAFAAPGHGRSVTLASVAEAAFDPEFRPAGAEAGLSSLVDTSLERVTYPNGCHAAEVEVDPETGAVTLVRYVAVDDFGTLVNPLLTEGQVHGGLAQGIGQALHEHTVYDDDGQLLSASLMDYQLPRAADLPGFEVAFDPVPSDANPLGVKGAGQAGAIAAPPTVMNALLDALAPLGVAGLDMPATPSRIWRAIRAARERPGA